jgi:hypothetical protein
MESLQNRILHKFERSSVSERESVFYGLYRMSVKAQNKLQHMDLDKIADKLNRHADSSSPANPALSTDEEAASAFMGETMNIESSVSATVDSSMISDVLASTRKSLVDLGTAVDADGKFKALSKSQIAAKFSELSGDGDYSGLAEALIIIIVGFFVLLAIAAVAIVGLSFAAFGVPGAIVATVVVGVGFVILFSRH